MNLPTTSAYRLLIIGANGGVGRQCVEIALEAGHHVKALVRNPANLPITHHNLQIVKGDITQPGTLLPYLRDTDAVISAIGVKGGFGGDRPTTLYSQGAKNILQEMKATGAQRVFFISASAIEISPVIPFVVRLAAKYIVQRLLRHMYDDLRRMETIVKESDADWTIIRPPRLTNRPATGHYRFVINSFLKNCLQIGRADLAHFMIHHINDEATHKSTIEIAK